MRASITGSISPPRMPIQRPSKHHAKHVDRRLRVPSPCGRLEHVTRTRLQIGVIGLPHRLGWKVWMNVIPPRSAAAVTVPHREQSAG